MYLAVYEVLKVHWVEKAKLQLQCLKLISVALHLWHHNVTLYTTWPQLVCKTLGQICDSVYLVISLNNSRYCCLYLIIRLLMFSWVFLSLIQRLCEDFEMVACKSRQVSVLCFLFSDDIRNNNVLTSSFLLCCPCKHNDGLIICLCVCMCVLPTKISRCSHWSCKTSFFKNEARKVWLHSVTPSCSHVPFFNHNPQISYLIEEKNNVLV